MSSIAVGVDIGGTSTRAVAAREGRPVGAVVRAPGANPTTNAPDAVDRSVADAVRAAVDEVAGRSEPVPATVVVGVAGLHPAATDEFAARVGEVVRAACDWPSRPLVDVRPDTEVAFAAGTSAPSGIVVIAGTGAIAARVLGGRQTCSVDGHGWRFGDAGSGSWIGARLVRHCLEALDGRAERGPLVDAVIGALDIEPGDAEAVRWSVVRRTTDAHASEIAALARLVATCRDPVGSSVVADAVDELHRSVHALAPSPGETVVLAGGLLGDGHPVGAALGDRLLAAQLRVEHAGEPVHGALRLARERAG